MAISTTAGARFFIGPIINPDDINSVSDGDALTIFQAITDGDWDEVGEVEDLGEHGDSSESITFTSIANKRVRKLKGPRDAGTKSVICGRDPLDEGQAALKAAEKTDYNYAFKIVYNDARTDAYTNSVEFFAGMVLTNPTDQGDVSNVTRITFDIGINTGIYSVDSEPVTT